MQKTEKRITVTIIGAGGKMGTRILNNLVKGSHDLLFCEKSQAGIERIREKGLSVTDMKEAVPESDVVIMAVPDAILGKLSQEVVPKMRKDSIIVFLDPAAAYAGEVAVREDCTFVVVHPCHPALFDEQETPEAREDVFGGIAAKQDIVIALLHGTEENFQIAQNICRAMFAPVVEAHRITVEQMAILEPAMAEVIGASCAALLKEAMDEAIARGVPEKAARAFMLGHIKIALAIIFKSSNPFSDAAVKAVRYGSQRLFNENWRNLFDEKSIKEVLKQMLHPDERE